MSIVEIHVDFACPFSYLGGEKMLQVLESEGKNLDSVRFRSYQLNPNDDNTKPNYFKNRMDAANIHLVEDYKKMFDEMIGNSGRKLGLNFDPETVISTNSVHAHLGLQYATKNDKQAEYFRAVMKAHWEDGVDYYDLTFINDTLEKIGLDPTEFQENLTEWRENLASDIALAQKRKIRGVPSFYKEKLLNIQSNSPTIVFKQLINN